MLNGHARRRDAFFYRDNRGKTISLLLLNSEHRLVLAKYFNIL